MQDQEAIDLQIPDKLYFKIGEVARLVDVPTYVLRFWETEFAALKPKRTEAGQRLYRRKDVELVYKIKHLLYARRFTIQGARRHLNVRTKTDAPPARKDTQESASGISVAEIRKTLEEIRDLLN